MAFIIELLNPPPPTPKSIKSIQSVDVVQLLVDKIRVLLVDEVVVVAIGVVDRKDVALAVAVVGLTSLKRLLFDDVFAPVAVSWPW